MPEPAAPAPDAPRSPPRSPGRPTGRRGPRPLRLALGLLLLLLLAWAVAVAVSGAQAARALQRVADAAPALEADLRAQRLDAAAQRARGVAADSATAARATTQVPYRLATHLPWAGAQLRAVQGGAQAAALLTEPLPQALDLARDVTADGLVSADRRVDVASLQRLAPVVVDYRDRVDRARGQLAAAEDPAVVAPLAERLSPVAAQVDALAGPLDAAADLLPRLPAALGADGPRTYLVGFTNPAEVRPVQGIVGAYAYLRVDDGRIELVATGTDDDLRGSAGDVAVNGPDFVALHGGDPDAGIVQNLTVGGQADDAARLAVSLFTRAGLPRPDGVALVDPVGLSQLLGTEHPPLDLGPFGQVAVPDLPQVLMADAYVRFAEDTPGRKAFLTTASAAAFEAVLSDGLSASALRGAGEAVRSGHLALWSADPAEQSGLAAAGVAGLFGPPGPVAHLGLTNSAPSKLDVWTTPQVQVQGPCRPAGATATTTLRLRLTSSPPAQVTGYARNQVATTPEGRRTPRDVVSLWVSPQVELAAVTVDGRPAATAVDTDRGWRLVRLTVDLPPDVPVEVRWELRGPRGALPATVRGPATVRAPQVATAPC